jgi:hypothetical protein
MGHAFERVLDFQSRSLCEDAPEACYSRPSIYV